MSFIDPDFVDPDSPKVAKGPNDWSEQYKKYTAEVKQRRQRTPIPGSEEYDSTPAMSYEDFVKSKDKKQLDKYIGGLEAGLSMISGIPATIGAAMSGISAPLNPLAQHKNPLKQFEQFLADTTYSPRTIEGQRMAETAGHFMQAFPAVGSYVHIPRVPKGPKAPKVDPVLETLRKTQEVPEPKPAFVDPDAAGSRAMENIVESQTTGWNEPVRNNGTGNGMDTIVQQSEAARMAEAQRVIEARQAALEQEVRQRATLDLNAAERQRQQNAPTGYSDWEMEQRMREIDERNQFFERAKQDSIVEDFGNNDPLARMPEMRIDENGIPIRADLSMEAANLENPLQRNLWGDELPHRTGDGGVPLTQAIDSMPRGPDREIAIANLRGHQEINRIKGIENSVGIPEELGRFEGEGGGLGRGQRGAIDLDAFKRAKASPDDVHNYVINREKLWGDQPINPKVRPLVEALNNHGIVTELSGDMYGAGVNYVDLNIPYFKYGYRLELPAGWYVGPDLAQHTLAMAGREKEQYHPAWRNARSAFEFEKERLSKDYVPKTRIFQSSERAITTAKAKQLAAKLNQQINESLFDNKTVRRKGGKQSGAIDVSIFDPSYDQYKKLNDNLVLRFRGGPEPTVYAIDTTNKSNPTVISHARFGRDTPWRPTSPEQNIQANWVHTLPEHQKKGIAQEMYKFVAELGNDIIPDDVQTGSGKKLWQSMIDKGIAKEADFERYYAKVHGNQSSLGLKRTQAGALNFKAIEETAKKIGDNLEKIGNKAINVLTPKEKAIPSAVRGHDYIPKGHAPENIIAAALAEGKDGPSMNQYLQSGLQLAGEKANSQLQIGVARWLSWAEKMATKSFRDNIKPLEQTLTRLNRKELNQAWSILKDEMFNRAQYGVDAIRDSGASERVIAAYEGLRKNFDDALETINTYRAKIGKEPITKQAAYLSSQWNGNYHVPLYDKSGKLVWYIKTTSAREARKALAWIGENHPDIDVSKSKPQYKPSELSPRIPKDITDVVSDMIKLFGEDSAIAKEMAAIVEEAKAAEAFNSRGFKVHFEEKANIRGFLGDRPWLSEHENAVQGMKAQIQYLKDAYRWAPMQEALANVKQVLGNEELIAQQPNNMAMAKAYTANALGVTKNIFKPAENAVARVLGTSPTAFTKAIGDMKSITYLQLLGASTGYALATPLQAFILGPSRHMLISADGIKHNPLATLFASISDGAKIVINHELSANFTGKSHDIGLTPFGKEAKRYMEENGIATINLFDEYSDLGEHKGVAAGKKLLGFTISVPEKIARSMTFMSFAHHLNDGGFKGTKAELFRRAEELTDDTLTKFTKSARPLAVDSMGMAGELAYTFQSPLFNYYNNLGLLARNAKTNPLPLLMAAFAMPMLLGGTSAIPGINEADGAWNLIKGLLAKHAPGAYNKVKDFGIREFQLEHLPDWATYGSVSEATGTQMATRFSTQAIDVEDPLGKIGPVPSAIGNWAQIPGAIGGETAAKQALWSNAPPMGKGIVEGTMDRFKAGPERADGRQPMLNPSRLSENVNSNYARNKEDKIKRMFGLTSLDEARSKEVNYLNAQESKRAKTARDAAVNKLWDGVMTKNEDKVKDNAKIFFELNGSDTEFESALNRKMENTYLTQQERDAIKANTLAKIMNLKRRLQMEK